MSENEFLQLEPGDELYCLVNDWPLFYEGELLSVEKLSSDGVWVNGNRDYYMRKIETKFHYAFELGFKGY